MDITKLLMSQLGEGGIESLANKIGADKEKTTSAIEGVVPTLLGAMSSNAKSDSGASGFLAALDRDHDGSILDDISGFIGNTDGSAGQGILNHVLGGNQSNVESGLSSKTGLNSNQISSLLQTIAPLVMGYLGKQKRQSNSGFDTSSIGGLLGSLTSTSDNSTGLDLGDILNVVGGLTGGNSSNSNSGGIGGMLGKLFGR